MRELSMTDYVSHISLKKNLIEKGIEVIATPF